MTASTLPPCDVLEWDSDFWNLRVARVRGEVLTPELARQIDGWCRQHAVCCLYFLARSDDVETVRLAEDGGYRFVDIRVTLRRTVESALDGGQRFAGTVRDARADDLVELRSIARAGYRDSRFYADPRFPPDRCDALYETWITRSVEGYADRVLVAELDGRPAGYVSCHVAPTTHKGSIGLVGVASWGQGQGAGSRLVMDALQWFRSREVRDVSVVTQGRNVAAQRLYQRGGFLTDSVQLWYHKWYLESGVSYR